MSVVTPERERSAPAPPSEPPERPPRRRFPTGLVVLGLTVLALLAAVNWVRDVLPSFDLDNPFRAETIDRSGPALLRSIQDLREYRAATGQFEVIVDVEEDTGLPSFLLGERTLFVAVGSVDASVDFSGIGSGAVEVSGDRTAATITLPRPTLSRAEVDLDQSYVYDRDEGALNEIGGLFADDDGDQRELYLLASRRLQGAAQQGSGLVARAEHNTRAMLASMLRSLGFTRVDVRFSP